jgi:hypothetical protein
MVEFTAATGLKSTKPLMARLEAEGKARGGIQHWGMFNDLNESDVRRAYRDLDRWLAVRWLITQNGTIRTFDNDFTKRCGLSGPPIRDISFLTPLLLSDPVPKRTDISFLTPLLLSGGD